MVRTLIRSIGILLVLASGHTATAQIVRVGGYGGVRVRAPFVAVDVLPWGGGTRVRAPFTSVRTGAYRYGAYYGGSVIHYGRHHHHRYHHHYYGPSVFYEAAPVIIPPVSVYEAWPAYPAVAAYPPVVAAYPSIVAEYPTVAPPYARIDQSLADRLRDAAARLSQSLSLRRDDAEVWLDYLGPNLIVDVIDRGADWSVLRDLVGHYDGVVANPDLGSIRASSGFSETRQLLKQYLSSVEPTEPAPVRQQPQAEPVPQQPQAEPVPQQPQPAPVPPQPQPVPPQPAPASESEPIQSAAVQPPVPTHL